jgi:hypothetical protein
MAVFDDDFLGTIGGGASGDVFAVGAAPEARKAVLTVTLSRREDRNRTQQEVEVEHLLIMV